MSISGVSSRAENESICPTICSIDINGEATHQHQLLAQTEETRNKKQNSENKSCVNQFAHSFIRKMNWNSGKSSMYIMSLGEWLYAQAHSMRTCRHQVLLCTQTYSFFWAKLSELNCVPLYFELTFPKIKKLLFARVYSRTLLFTACINGPRECQMWERTYWAYAVRMLLRFLSGVNRRKICCWASTMVRIFSRCQLLRIDEISGGFCKSFVDSSDSLSGFSTFAIMTVCAFAESSRSNYLWQLHGWSPHYSTHSTHFCSVSSSRVFIIIFVSEYLVKYSSTR